MISTKMVFRPSTLMRKQPSASTMVPPTPSSEPATISTRRARIAPQGVAVPARDHDTALRRGETQAGIGMESCGNRSYAVGKTVTAPTRPVGCDRSPNIFVIANQFQHNSTILQYSDRNTRRHNSKCKYCKRPRCVVALTRTRGESGRRRCRGPAVRSPDSCFDASSSREPLPTPDQIRGGFRSKTLQ
jgi:hypothetical protein